LSTSIYADALIGVQGYRFEVTNGSTVRTYDATTNLFNLTQLTGGASYNTTYSIRVAANVNGTWRPYGASCNVTTPDQPVVTQPNVTKPSEVVTPVVAFKVSAYPNPYTESFKLDVTTTDATTVSVKVYDMTGKLVDDKMMEVSEITTTELGQNYPTGVYNVIVTQATEVKTLKLIKR
jgi:hypothetical protein